jgi:hypothetical protein
MTCSRGPSIVPSLPKVPQHEVEHCRGLAIGRLRDDCLRTLMRSPRLAEETNSSSSRKNGDSRFGIGPTGDGAPTNERGTA